MSGNPLCFIVFLFVFMSCTSQITVDENTSRLSEEELLTRVQEKTFQYFWEGAESNSGLARERIHLDEPDVDEHVVTTGGSGFGLMALIVGIEREFISREQGISRLSQIINFLDSADRFHGVWPHWLDGRTGKVIPFSPMDDGGDLVESSFLTSGLITVRQYLDQNNQEENELIQRINTMLNNVEWDWYTQGKETLYWHWSPNYDWHMNFAIDGYNECLITYVMAASSSEHGIAEGVYHNGWAGNGEIVSANEKYGHQLVLEHNFAEEYGGPLFWAHYSYLGLDPRKLQDKYAEYWKLNKNHSLINYQWCIENPNNFKGYGPAWGLTSSYSLNFYHGHKPGDDLGVISPTAALSSMPYTPQESMRALEYFYYDLGDSLFGKYGFYDAYSEDANWFVPRYLAIDQGPIIIMIENYRTGLIWDLFMSAPEVQSGLNKLGFTY